MSGLCSGLGECVLFVCRAGFCGGGLEGGREEGVVVLLFFYGGDGAVAGADQGCFGEGKYFFADVLPGEFEVVAGAANGAGEDGVADDGNGRRFAGKGVDDVGYSIGGMAGGLAPGDLQFSEREVFACREFLVFGGMGGVGVDGGGRGLFSHFAEGFDVVVVGVGDEDVFQDEAELFQQLCNWPGSPAGVEEGGFAGGAIPEEETVDGHPAVVAFDLPEVTPLGEVMRVREPALGDAAEFCAVEVEQFRRGFKVDSIRRFATFFKLRELFRANPGGGRNLFARNIAPHARLAEDVSGVVFKLHRERMPARVGFVHKVLRSVRRLVFHCGIRPPAR